MIEPPLRLWRILRLVAIYRLLLALLLLFLGISGYLPAMFGQEAPQLFLAVTLVYLVLSCVMLYPLWRPVLGFALQNTLYCLIDILFISLLMFASGGVSSGVGMLLVISVANAGMLASGRMAFFFAALASLAVLAEGLYRDLMLSQGQISYPLAGLLGLTLFVTALLAQVLSKRAQDQELLAQQRGIDLENISRLTDFVIQKMATGVIVVGQTGQVRLVNQMARDLLQIQDKPLGQALSEYSVELNLQLQLWKHHLEARPARKLLLLPQGRILMQILPFGEVNRAQGRHAVLMLLEQAEAVEEQAQQLKLAALGRLTASIAHEIRNPLSAIHHAGSLLQESPSLCAEDQRLTQIIAEQSQRINQIVEDVLQLGRSNRQEPQALDLTLWLPRFVQEFHSLHTEVSLDLELESEAVQGEGGWSAQTRAWFDALHLQRILTNLCVNAVRHALQGEGEAKVVLKLARLTATRAFLEVCDTGPGVPKAQRDQLFEPFYTTVAKGTGLGLYLSRELAQANQAELSYREQETGGACFRLTFNCSESAQDSA
ncbi:sensor histidine kinase [Nitrincola tapanii]|uniref:histidine kinase n=1 Tax=Nitrincola tapanii TaxID=1708751 RepID=A0A5A9W4R4_9GAMM|nr:ATP-binding protein [Nitrincola tapanii]KAA0875484.1 hypothetical protein E1H14_05755 [Nitrincola tapanii]